MSDPSHRSIPFHCAQTFCRITSSVFFDLKVFGLQNVPNRGGVLLLSNHQSYLDPVLVGVHLKRPLSYMAKSQLFEVNPAFTWLIRSLGAFPVRQTGSAAGAVKTAINRLKDGYALAVFPEGSRTPDGRIAKIEGGSALIVRGAGVPVVPVAIHGSFEAWRHKQKVPRPFPIRISYGKPMQLAQMKSAEIVRQVDQSIRQLFDELKRRAAAK